MFPGGYWWQAVKEDRVLQLDTPDRTWDAFSFEPKRLCSSRSGRIQLLPSVPKTTTVAFRKFLARGGSEVSAEIVAGQITRIEITPRRDNSCTLVLPPMRSSVVVTDADGTTVDSTIDNSGDSLRLRFDAQQGTTYLVVQAP
ncbi:hypothetical protein Pla123a_13970 [Posidoniimonas polymericola]|uniref:Alpha fucosidase A-like C-terminal domain-containing protein n=1 Tax=Posidoniimonas polymericola TaxID=2528002 RepID=A0A5C5YRM6_9BACT|nr:hypothetical protein [Posidoniimonas polymericola]TWT77601.1 hypothetical protein Pla123a_13970 [Posidoniimonas polymericola]